MPVCASRGGHRHGAPPGLRPSLTEGDDLAGKGRGEKSGRRASSWFGAIARARASVDLGIMLHRGPNAWGSTRPPTKRPLTRGPSSAIVVGVLNGVATTTITQNARSGCRAQTSSSPHQQDFQQQYHQRHHHHDQQQQAAATKRVRFSHEGTNIAIIIVYVPRDSYVDKMGDPRDASNPNFMLLGMARDNRLSGVAESLLLAKLLWHWRGLPDRSQSYGQSMPEEPRCAHLKSRRAEHMKRTTRTKKRRRARRMDLHERLKIYYNPSDMSS